MLSSVPLTVTPNQRRDYATLQEEETNVIDALQQQAEQPRRTIVLVEDDPANAEVLALLLQIESVYNVLSFRDGVEVLANLDNIKEKRPALFLLDYQLSGMTALDLYEQFHTIEELKSIPAIIISATTLNEVKKKRLQEFGLLLIQKPYDIDDLLAAIEQAAT